MKPKECADLDVSQIDVGADRALIEHRQQQIRRGVQQGLLPDEAVRRVLARGGPPVVAAVAASPRFAFKISRAGGALAAYERELGSVRKLQPLE